MVLELELELGNWNKNMIGLVVVERSTISSIGFPLTKAPKGKSLISYVSRCGSSWMRSATEKNDIDHPNIFLIYHSL